MILHRRAFAMAYGQTYPCSRFPEDVDPQVAARQSGQNLPAARRRLTSFAWT